ncbi:hypothetical protein ACO2Q5_19895, partial [Neotabrizicola sp. VNH66]
SPNRDLLHRIPLERVAVVARPHLGLLASKLGRKASTNLGAPHFMGWGLRHAQNVIEHYARLTPGESDRILEALTAAKRGVA